MVNRKYAGVTFNREVGRKDFTAEITDGDVVGWQPISLKELNEDIDTCILYLQNIKKAMKETK